MTLTYAQKFAIATSARMRGHVAAVEGDKGRYWRELSTAFRLMGLQENATICDHIAEVSQ